MCLPRRGGEPYIALPMLRLTGGFPPGRQREPSPAGGVPDVGCLMCARRPVRARDFIASRWCGRSGTDARGLGPSGTQREPRAPPRCLSIQQGAGGFACSSLRPICHINIKIPNV